MTDNNLNEVCVRVKLRLKTLDSGVFYNSNFLFSKLKNSAGKNIVVVLYPMSNKGFVHIEFIKEIDGENISIPECFFENVYDTLLNYKSIQKNKLFKQIETWCNEGKRLGF